MNEELWKNAEKLANRNYTIMVSVEKATSGEQLFMAKNPELVGCMAEGNSLEDAIANLKEARVDYIYDSLKSGSKIPDPAPIAVQTVGTADFVNPNAFKIEKQKGFDDNLGNVVQPKNSKVLYKASINT